jgi:hypothetical protein
MDSNGTEGGASYFTHPPCLQSYMHTGYGRKSISHFTASFPNYTQYEDDNKTTYRSDACRISGEPSGGPFPRSHPMLFASSQCSTNFPYCCCYERMKLGLGLAAPRRISSLLTFLLSVSPAASRTYTRPPAAGCLLAFQTVVSGCS